MYYNICHAISYFLVLSMISPPIQSQIPVSLLQSLEKIIQRDFFPDVTKLQAQKDYLEAEDNGDLERMREISIRYGSSLTKSTPRSSAPCELYQK